MSSPTAEPFHERAYDDWLAHCYDDWYPPTDETYCFLTQLLSTFPELTGRSRADLDLWDCACGTGATFIPLSKAGYRPWGSDGSVAMLEKTQTKCTREGLSKERLILESLSWNDTKRCRRLVGATQNFDVIFALNNSLCHMPRAPGYLDASLKNFYDRLKPGGRLVVDTKRYRNAAPLRGVDMYEELRFDNGAWTPRDVKEVTRTIDGVNTLFHTSLVYDADPVFHCCRATILTTIHANGPPRTHAVRYYPLPADEFAELLSAAGFVVELIPAQTPPLSWGYDCLVAQRR